MEWNITVVNKTGDQSAEPWRTTSARQTLSGEPRPTTLVNQTLSGELRPITSSGGVEVDFMLFQTVPKLSVGSYSNVWRLDKVGYPGNVGPIVLPTKVELVVIDKISDGDPRQTGPFAVKFGRAYNVVQKKEDDVPTITDLPDQVPQGKIEVMNASGNAKSLQMALSKGRKLLLSYKDITPGNAVYLAVAPAIYIANVNSNNSVMHEGDEFPAAVEAAQATKFALHADKSEVTILIKMLQSGEIKFVEQD